MCQSLQKLLLQPNVGLYDGNLLVQLSLCWVPSLWFNHEGFVCSILYIFPWVDCFKFLYESDFCHSVLSVSANIIKANALIPNTA